MDPGFPTLLETGVMCGTPLCVGRLVLEFSISNPEPAIIVSNPELLVRI